MLTPKESEWIYKAKSNNKERIPRIYQLIVGIRKKNHTSHKSQEYLKVHNLMIKKTRACRNLWMCVTKKKKSKSS